MALNTAEVLNLDVWIDRARIVKEQIGIRTEGETNYTWESGEWFRCRFPPREARENNGGVVTVLEDTYQVTGSLLDVAGDLVEVTERDRIEIEAFSGTSYVTFGTFEVDQVMIPRNGVGDDLLLVMQIIKIEEWS